MLAVVAVTATFKKKKNVGDIFILANWLMQRIVREKCKLYLNLTLNCLS